MLYCKVVVDGQLFCLVDHFLKIFITYDLCSNSSCHTFKTYQLLVDEQFVVCAVVLHSRAQTCSVGQVLFLTSNSTLAVICVHCSNVTR